MQVAVLHIAAYYLGYRLARATVAAEDVPLARCISLESGMQSSLLGLLLASRFFHDPLVSLPCGISTIFMTLVSCPPSPCKVCEDGWSGDHPGDQMSHSACFVSHGQVAWLTHWAL